MRHTGENFTAHQSLNELHLLWSILTTLYVTYKHNYWSQIWTWHNVSVKFLYESLKSLFRLNISSLEIFLSFICTLKMRSKDLISKTVMTWYWTTWPYLVYQDLGRPLLAAHIYARLNRRDFTRYQGEVCESYTLLFKTGGSKYKTLLLDQSM